MIKRFLMTTLFAVLAFPAAAAAQGPSSEAPFAVPAATVAAAEREDFAVPSTGAC